MSSNRYHGFLSFQSRGLVSFPRELRERLGAETPGAQLEIEEREDGVFELKPMIAIPAEQAWFWSRRWQSMEQEADADIAAGRTDTFEDVEDLITDLDQ
ncbi:MAG TPA: AbrB/MazE/SpoVT family DNA-binding domain-containing protein [Acidimicrobiales bacterium]|nr:AbrB/MazE/SpoVT family DNA-binding domain-containing protein [Acidimicrobiales bacterium]